MTQDTPNAGEARIEQLPGGAESRIEGDGPSPYAKVSADLPLHQLFDGQSAHPAPVFLWFMAALSADPNLENRVRVSPSYGEIMLGTGISRQQTIVKALQHLHQVGLVMYDGVGADGYRYYEVCRTYVIAGPGAPEGDSKSRYASRTGFSSSYLDSGGLGFKGLTTTDSTPARSAPLDARLAVLDVAVNEDTWWALIEEHGLGVVVKYGRWYAHAHAEGLANGTGWLFKAVRDRWETAPLGFNEADWWTDEERAQARKRDADRWGVEY